jgi:hypothetical protein
VAVIIDLGEIGETQEAPGSWSTRVEVRQRFLSMATVVLILCTLVGSEPALPRLADPLWSTRSDAFGFLLGADTAYVIDPDGHLISGATRRPATSAGRCRSTRPRRSCSSAEAGVVAVQSAPSSGVPTERQVGVAKLLVHAQPGPDIGSTAVFGRTALPCLLTELARLRRLHPAVGG